jgi:hypothetical protein
MSVPRVTEEAAKLGCKDGGSYDIENGWGCLHEELQDACLKQMETNGVDVVIVTPPCDQFSQLQNCTKRSGEGQIEFERRLKDALVLLKFALRACQWAQDTGRYFLFELADSTPRQSGMILCRVAP